MTDTLFEDRLRRALNEIADAVPELPERPIAEGGLRAEPASRRRVVLVAAAFLVVVGMATALVMIDRQGGDGDVSVVADDARAVDRGRSLLSLAIESTTVHLQAAGGRCVDLRLVDPGAAPGVMANVDHDPACLGDGKLAIQAASVQGKTLVYGITSRSGEVVATTSEVAGSAFHEAPLGDGVAFILVIDHVAASGVVSLLDVGDLLGQATFDRGGPARAPKEPVGSARILLPFVRQGAVWAALDDGREVRLTDGTERHPDTGPFLAPDGSTVLYGNGLVVELFGITYSVNVRTGETRRVGALGTLAFSPDGRFLATSVPKDDVAPEAIRILDTETYEGVRDTVVFGGGGETFDLEEVEAIGTIQSLAWDSDGRRLLAITQPWERGTRFWSVDPEDGSTVELQSRGVPSGVQWSMPDHASTAGRFPALAMGEDAVTWGELRVEEGIVRFDDIDDLPERASRPDGSEVPLDLGSPPFAFIRQLQTPIAVDDRGTIVASGDEPVYLLTGANGRLFLLSPSGHVRSLER